MSTPNAEQYLFQGEVSPPRVSTPNAEQYFFQGEVRPSSVSTPDAEQYFFQGTLFPPVPFPGEVGTGTVLWPILEVDPELQGPAGPPGPPGPPGPDDVMPISSVYGTVSLAPSATGTIVSLTTGGMTERLWGFQANGDADGIFELQVTSSTILSIKTNAVEPDAEGNLPAPVDIAPGTLVSLIVTNNGLGTVTYRGSVFIG